MQVIRAERLGMCFGVRDAIALAFGRAEAAPLTILGDLVHNAGVLGALRAKGIAIVHDSAHVETDTVMVTAHGASARALASTRARAQDRGGAGRQALFKNGLKSWSGKTGHWRGHSDFFQY